MTGHAVVGTASSAVLSEEGAALTALQPRQVIAGGRLRRSLSASTATRGTSDLVASSSSS
jgi:hypothetical protein